MSTAELETRFADRIRTLRPSCVREIMRRRRSGDVISFAGGLPSPRLFPVEAIAEAAARVLRDNGRSALQYSSSEGYPPLREYVAETCPAAARHHGLGRRHPDHERVPAGAGLGRQGVYRRRATPC